MNVATAILAREKQLREWAINFTHTNIRDAAALLGFFAALAYSGIPQHVLLDAARNPKLSMAFVTAACAVVLVMLLTAAWQAKRCQAGTARRTVIEAASVLVRAFVFVPIVGGMSAAQAMAVFIFEALA